MSPADSPRENLPPPSAPNVPGTGRALRWRLRSRAIELPLLPRLMGIVNVTPDSFSDGGRFFATGAAIDHGLRLVAEGADLLDVGGESTRPYSAPVDAEEELRRVLPVVCALADQSGVPISIDTSKADVARACLDAGAEIINDVTAFRGDARMTPLAVESGAGVCAMHMRGTPQSMQDDPRYDDVVRDVGDFLESTRDALEAAGIDRERIALDPGIGFGKTHAHNMELLTRCAALHRLECPLLLGFSRKGFLAKLTGDAAADRTPGNIAVALALAQQGVQILRVHDVQAVRHALLVHQAVRPA